MAKEIIKSNVVEAPTLFIGVGGTGGKIVKRVAEMCRPGEAENINFVCLDTNVNDLGSVAQSKANIYYVQTSNTQTVGSYLHYDQDALRNWFPKNAVIYDKTVSEGAGQVRAISRLALNATIKTGKIRPLYDAIDDLFRQSGKAMKQTVRCCIVSTASGGTGSGILLPLSIFVRDYVNTKYPNTSLIIRSLVLLPETLDSVIDSTVERESQRRNAYATIKELNAFMMKGSGFFDVSEELVRYRDLHIDFAVPGTSELRSLSLLPCDFCFLMDGQNAEDSTLVNFNQYMVQAAQALYEQNIGPMQKMAYSVEDNIIKEMSNPGNLGRNRFGGIGASVIKYPYDEIADYIAYEWAKNSIGGDGEAAKWSRYDKKFQQERIEARKKETPESEMPKIEDVYCSLLENGEDKFSKDLRSSYLSSADDRLDAFFGALSADMHDAVMHNQAIELAAQAANRLRGEMDYNGGDSDQRGNGSDNLGLLRTFEMAVNTSATKVAQRAAEGLLLNPDSKTINEQKDATLEKLLKNIYGEVGHPNAMRYMLYRAKAEFIVRIDDTTAEIQKIRRKLQRYSPEANDPAFYDVKSNGKGNVETCIDDVCAIEKAGGEDPSIFERIGGYGRIYEIYNAVFPDYYKQIDTLAKKIAELEAYRIGRTYVDELCKMFERFYGTFGEKVSALMRLQDEVIDKIAFHKGDSTLNICSTEALVKELSHMTRSKSEEGSKLDSELNAKIFDAIKSNVLFEREARINDFVEEDRRVDIFDDIILGYFKESVRNSCDMIDLNIIDAIAMENRLRTRIRLREESSGDETVYEKLSQEDNLRYIREIIAKGERLAAPSIQRLVSEEPRQVTCSAYNKSLDDMRSFRISDLLPKGTSVDTISRYELHFFNALYNLTPDKLNKFASPLKTETGVKNAGMYHNAYVSYARNIGPDSTKNMMISTHIDKRWDSISSMPEIDLDYQAARMMKIHKAMIYGLVYGAISYQVLSHAAGGKKIFKYESADEHFIEMIVSNGTLCDEFYEILDALYISPSIVEDIDLIKAKRRIRDNNRNSNYADTAFAKALQEFEIELLHEGPTSLFEIPLAYYNSLPNSQRYTFELSALAEAVIAVFSEELYKWEKPSDAKFMLCDILREQFILMVENYHKYETLNLGNPISDNEMINLIYRRIRSTISTTPEPSDFEETLTLLKSMIE